jgi:hypothetical protein
LVEIIEGELEAYPSQAPVEPVLFRKAWLSLFDLATSNIFPKYAALAAARGGNT